MSMFVWPDGTVTGSVNVAELEQIRAAQKAAGKRRLAAIGVPIESAEHLADLLAGVADPEPEPEPEPEPKAAAKKEK